MDEKLLEKLDALTLAVHELAYAQAATAAMVARQAGIGACPEDFLSGNERPDRAERFGYLPKKACNDAET